MRSLGVVGMVVVMGLGLAVLNSLDCEGSPPPEKKTGFTVSETINGQDPSAAIYSFYGSVNLDAGGGKVDFGLVSVASSDENLCENLHGDFQRYINDTAKGKIDGTIVWTKLYIHGDFQYNKKYIGDGRNVIVETRFGISNGQDPLVLSEDHHRGSIIEPLGGVSPFCTSAEPFTVRVSAASFQKRQRKLELRC